MFLKKAYYGSHAWIAANYSNGVSISKDNGATWTNSKNGMTSSNLYIQFPPAYGNGKLMLINNKDGAVYTSTNNGDSWTCVGNTGKTNGQRVLGYHKNKWWALNKCDTNENSRMMFSEDDGRTWTENGGTTG